MQDILWGYWTCLQLGPRVAAQGLPRVKPMTKTEIVNICKQQLTRSTLSYMQLADNCVALTVKQKVHTNHIIHEKGQEQNVSWGSNYTLYFVYGATYLGDGSKGTRAAESEAYDKERMVNICMQQQLVNLANKIQAKKKKCSKHNVTND